MMHVFPSDECLGQLAKVRLALGVELEQADNDRNQWVVHSA